MMDLADENEKKPIKSRLKNCKYLEDSGIEIFGIKIYGSPWYNFYKYVQELAENISDILLRQPTHRGWAFNADRGETILKHWNKIPDDADVLITHGPPLGTVLDLYFEFFY